MVYQDIWDRATGYDDETSLDGVSAWLWGLKDEKNQIVDLSFPVEGHEASKMGQWYHTITAGNRLLTGISAQFYPVNGICFWDMYGKATHTTPDTVQTVTNMTATEGEKPKKKLYYQADATTFKYDIFGAVTHSLSLKYDQNGLVATQSQSGTLYQGSSSTPNTPSCPDDASNNAVEDPFDLFHSWKWNSVAMEKPFAFEMQATQKLVPYMKGTSDRYVSYSEHNPIGTGFSVTQWGSTDMDDIHTDFLAGTKRTLTWKMLKGADVTKYFEVTASNCLCTMFIPIRNQGAIIGFTTNFIAENVSTVIADSVDDDFYTIAT